MAEKRAEKRAAQALDPHPTKLDMERKLKALAEKGRPGAADALAQLQQREPAAGPALSYGVRASATSRGHVRMVVGEITIDTNGHVTTRRDIDVAQVPGVGERDGRRLRLVLPFAPRTKKNSKAHYTKQGPAYRRFRDQVVKHLELVTHVLGLPLPDGEYNIAATYYVDGPGERADRPGLDQGLFDALQDAGVIGNDWQFRTTDGTRIVFGDPKPRVELVITPLTEA